MECILPEYRIENVKGYTDEEVKYYVDFIRKVANMILVKTIK